MLFEVAYITNRSYPNVISERIISDNYDNVILYVERHLEDANIISFESVTEIKSSKNIAYTHS